MSILEIIMVSIGLSFDSLAVTIYKGATQGSLNKNNNFLVGIIFGGIQTLMLSIGLLIAWFPISSAYSEAVISVNKWFSSIIFIYLGLKMLRSALKSKRVDEKREDFSYKIFVSLAFATSLDALILGIGVGLLATKLLMTILIVFIFTSILSMVGVAIGYQIGDKYRTMVNTLGSMLLLIMGVKTILTYFQLV